MPIYTSMLGVNLKPTPRDPRNRHLLPEASATSRRLMTGVAQETQNAVDFNTNDLAYYKKLKLGVKCSCTYDSIESSSASAPNVQNLSDFLLRVPTLTKSVDFCPICYKTGFVGGYSRVGSFSLCLDALANPTLSKGMQLVKERPYYYQPSSKLASVEWEFVVPANFTSVVDVAIRWRETPGTWAIYLDDQEVTEANFIKLQGEKAKLRVDMQDASNPEAGMYCVFITFGVAQNILVPSDFPQLNYVYTGEMHMSDEVESPITVNVDSRAGETTTTDVFIDSNNQRIWRVTGSNDNVPMGSYVHSALECRVVRPSEVYYLLPNKWIMKHYPTNLYSFIL